MCSFVLWKGVHKCGKLFVFWWSVCVSVIRDGNRFPNCKFSFIKEVVGRATSRFRVSIGLYMLPWQLTDRIVLKVICHRILELFDP